MYPKAKKQGIWLILLEIKKYFMLLYNQPVLFLPFDSILVKSEHR